MGIKFANQAFGTLSAGITAAATSITLSTGQGAKFPAVTAGSGDYFLLTLANTGAFEIAMCVARAGDVLTVFRGLEGTTAAAFSAGDACELRMTAGTMLDLSGLGSTSYRNKVRNPKMRIQQRGATFTSAGGYTYDGWIYTKVGTAVCTVSDGGLVLSNDAQNSLKLTVTTAQAVLATGDYGVIFQPIEGYMIRDLIGQPVAIRFEVISSKVGTFCCALRNRGTSPNDRSYCMPYTITAANTPQVVTLQLPTGFTSAGTWSYTNGFGCDLLFSVAVGATITAPSNNAWVQGNYYGVAGQANLFDTAGATFSITAVQMEKNLVSSALEHMDIALEWVLAERYLRVNRKSIAYCGAATQLVYTEQFGSPMRAAVGSATLLTSSPYCEQPVFSVGHTGAGSTIFGIHLLPNSVDIGVAGFSGLTVGAMAMFEAGQVIYSAEL